MKKKLFLSFVICATLLVSGIISASAETYGDLTYEIEKGKITITDFNKSFSGDFVIPSEIDGYSVTKIRDVAFCYSRNLTSVTIPDSVTYIGEAAFEHCTNLANVTFGNGITTIDDCAFQYCESLTEISIPDSVTYLDNYAFHNCSSLKTAIIGNGVEFIGVSAFEDCSDLKNVTIGNSVSYIAEYAFYNCSSLISVTIPQSVTEIWDGAFYRCNLLTIYGEEGSYAQTYANENKIPFIAGNPVKYSNATVTLTEDLSNRYFGISVDDYSGEGIVYVALYNGNNEIISIASRELLDVDAMPISLPIDERATYAKVFVWDELMQPIAYTETIKL